jgi:hypothetical protein
MGVQINGDTGNVIATKGTFSGDVGIGGTLTYEDVTNIDAVGLITARSGIEIGARPGVAASISVDGNAIISGITTVGGNIKVGSGITLSPDGHSFVAGVSTTGTLSVSGIVTSTGDVDPSTGTVTTSGNITVGGDLLLESVTPSIKLTDSNQETDNKTFMISGSSTQKLRIQALNDSGGGGGELFEFVRDGNNVYQFQGAKSANPWFVVNNNTRRVGIGSTNPRTPIHILAGGGSGIIEMQRSSVNTTGNTGCINFTASDGHSVASIGAYGAGDNESAYINFKTTEAASANSPFTSTTERFRILASGGVTFNGDTAAANALDDYEEGTFTPSYINLNVPGHATTNYATYTKVGRLVTIRLSVSISGSVSDGSGIGFALPYAPSSNERVVIPAISDRSGSNTDPFAFINVNQNSNVYAKSLDGYAFQTYNHFSGNYIVITGTYESA